MNFAKFKAHNFGKNIRAERKLNLTCNLSYIRKIMSISASVLKKVRNTEDRLTDWWTGQKHYVYTYCESTLVRGYQFPWIREEREICGFLNSWFWGFHYKDQRESHFHWEPIVVFWSIHKNHENWYSMNNSTLTVLGSFRSKE